MSLAVLARKTRAKQKLKKRGKFILNMTGRGNVLGMNAKMSRGNCKGLTTCAGKRAACCVGVGGSRCCEFPHGGQPAPQQGYRVYLNRKSKGAYRPAGGKQCKTLSGCTSAKSVWKQGSNLDAGEITRKRRDNTLACYTDVYTAKKDTCTGCPDKGPVLFGGTQTNTMVVGNIGNVYGFALATTPNIGSFTPQTINGVALSPPDGEVTYLNGTVSQVFSVVLPTGGLPQSFFTSISFVDGCNIRTYSTANASSFSAVGLTAQWQWNATASGYTDELAYWSSKVGTSLDVYVTDSTNNTVIPFCRLCCCPVKKNICGCRATDLVRYTRINKSFGCQTTKAVRMGRTASEQIARRRAAVDCIAPKHRTIFLNLTGNPGPASLTFDGCCGKQCLILGQQYTFTITSTFTTTVSLEIQWCAGLVQNITVPGSSTTSFSFTVPKFNKNCQPATEAVITSSATGSTPLRISYCKKAFKTPQMLGSCSGR